MVEQTQLSLITLITGAAFTRQVAISILLLVHWFNLVPLPWYH